LRTELSKSREVNRLAQSDQYRTDKSGICIHRQQQLVNGDGGTKDREYKCSHVPASQAGKRILGIAQPAVHGKLDLQFSVYGKFGLIQLHVF
jgi:hypothetical protein